MPRLTRVLIVGTVVMGSLAFFLGHPGPTRFNVRWSNVRDGMSQREVQNMLGTPTWTGNTGTIGSGGREVIEWQYKTGLFTYSVDFDYIGPGGAPLVFRTERVKKDWDWEWLWPLQRAKARA